MKNPNSWYNKTYLVVVLIIFIFPVGLYALWKNEKVPQVLKIGVTVFIALCVIFSWNSEIKAPPLDIKKEKQTQLRNMAFDSESKIKRNLKDPSSYELIDKDYRFLNDSIYDIKIKYSATNSFNARIQNQYIKTGILRYNKADTSFTDIVKFEN
jgi:hypothetical protein